MNPFAPGPETAKVRLFVFVAFGGCQPGLVALAATATRGGVKKISIRDGED